MSNLFLNYAYILKLFFVCLIKGDVIMYILNGGLDWRRLKDFDIIKSKEFLQ